MWPITSIRLVSFLSSRAILASIGDDFHLPRLRYVKATPYTDEIVEDTYHWMVRWGLISSAACAANLVDNRLSEAAATLDGA